MDKGEVPCPKCEVLMPAGHGSQCRRCYWVALLEKRIRMDCAALSSAGMSAHFTAFGSWLQQKVGEHKAALTIHRYLLFFMDIEKKWRDIPDYHALLVHFGAARLRQVLLPLRWMTEAGHIVPDEEEKADDSERRRITAILGKIDNGTKEKAILDGYFNMLTERPKARRAAVRSIRLAISPATALLRKAREMGCMPPDQAVLEVYLAKTPGQRAAVSGFVRYLREMHGAKIALAKEDAVGLRQRRRKRLEAEMLALTKEDGDGERFKRRWLSVALAYFHGLPRAVGRMARGDSVFTHDGGMVVVWANQQYWLPLPTRSA